MGELPPHDPKEASADPDLGISHVGTRKVASFSKVIVLRCGWTGGEKGRVMSSSRLIRRDDISDCDIAKRLAVSSCALKLSSIDCYQGVSKENQSLSGMPIAPPVG